MSRWSVNGSNDQPLAVVESFPGGTVTIVITSSDPMSWEKAEEIRGILGVAIGNAQFLAQDKP